MPNPQFTRPWHGVPRENIHWNPTIVEEACIGCGTCVTGCSRLVYRFDFERKKPPVADPLNCLVGCTTCANTCPAHAIAFPPIESVLALEGLAAVRHAVEDDLVARHDILAAARSLPHPERIVTLVVSDITHPTADVMRVTLKPASISECFCEFAPGQYIELWQPQSSHLSRSYSIANSPHGNGSIELHIRRVEGGRLTEWAFGNIKTEDQLQARGPLGGFTMRSPAFVPLLFVAGGTGIAPLLTLLEQQIRFNVARDMILIWGMRDRSDFYALDILREMLDVVSASTAMNFMRTVPAVLVAVVARASAADGPADTVVNNYSASEVRQYVRYIVAKVTVPGPVGEVGSEGLRLLSAYIFGGNKGRRSLAMTAPVMNAPVPVRLPMTAPVTQSANAAAGGGGGFIVRFTMPRGETLATLPPPENARVRLRELPGQLYAVITYSGRWTQANDQKHADVLRKATVDAGLKPVGKPVGARYDAPFVPPPLRHNEVWLSLVP